MDSKWKLKVKLNDKIIKVDDYNYRDRSHQGLIPPSDEGEDVILYTNRVEGEHGHRCIPRPRPAGSRTR